MIEDTSAVPAGPVLLSAQRCTGCGHCLDACPTDVFALDPASGRALVRFGGDCHVCFLCLPDCPTDAITIRWDAPNPRLRSVYDELSIELAHAPVPTNLPVADGA